MGFLGSNTEHVRTKGQVGATGLGSGNDAKDKSPGFVFQNYWEALREA